MTCSVERFPIAAPIYCRKLVWRLQITVGRFETSGQRGDDRMEDASAVSSPLDEALPHCHLLAVFDGHAGAGAAQHAAAHVRSQLQRHWGCATADAALIGVFETLDQDFRYRAGFLNDSLVHDLTAGAVR